METFSLTVIYKSGAKVTFTCTHFSVKGGVFKWEGAKPNPLILGVDEVAAIWEGRV